VVVVQVLGLRLSLTLGLLTVDPIGAFGLGELVDLTTSEAGKELLGKGVRNGLPCAFISLRFEARMRSRQTFVALMVFKGLEGGKSTGTGKHFVAKAALVVGFSVLHLVVVLLTLVW
jgi:hypothetical protein